MLLQELAAGVLGVLTRLGLEPLLDLVAGTRGLHHREPVPRGPPLALGGQHLDDVSGAQLVVQGHDLAVDAGADAAVPDVGVDLVGEVQRGGSRGQRFDLALGGEDIDLVLEEHVDLQALHELLGIRQLALPVDHRAKPAKLGVLARLGAAHAVLRAPADLLVHPVRRDAELGHLVHLARADLDLERASLGTEHGGVE